jgi:hypothetical protein
MQDGLRIARTVFCQIAATGQGRYIAATGQDCVGHITMLLVFSLAGPFWRSLRGFRSSFPRAGSLRPDRGLVPAGSKTALSERVLQPGILNCPLPDISFLHSSSALLVSLLGRVGVFPGARVATRPGACLSSLLPQ